MMGIKYFIKFLMVSVALILSYFAGLEDEDDYRDHQLVNILGISAVILGLTTVFI